MKKILGSLIIMLFVVGMVPIWATPPEIAQLYSLNEGETQTYTINNNKYEITNAYVANIGVIETMFSINGIYTSRLEEGDSYISGGIKLIISDIVEPGSEDYSGDEVKFMLMETDDVQVEEEIPSNEEDTTTTEIGVTSCTDSDGGMNYYEKGTVKTIVNNQEYTLEDACGMSYDNVPSDNPNIINEKYCDYGESIERLYECPNGCKDGACIEEPQIVCEMCENGIDTGKVDENGCRIYECPTKPPEEVCESYIDDEGCKITKCEGRVTKACPDEPMGKYVQLNEKFTLIEWQSVKVTDYGYLKITLTNWMCTGVCEVGTPCETSCAVTLQVEMPSECTTTIQATATEEGATTKIVEPCETAVGTNIVLNEGQSKQVFGAKITYLDKDGNRGVFVVQKPVVSIGGVDIEISPTQQSINYGEKAVYKITVTDKHILPKCETESERRCLMPARSYNYFIDIRNLPFLKEYTKQIELGAGQSKSFELVVSPYTMIKEGIKQEVEEEQKLEKKLVTVTVQKTAIEDRIVKPMFRKIAVQKEIQEIQEYKIAKTKESVATPSLIVEKPTEITPTVIGLYRTYKFNVRVMQKNNPQNQDVSYAVLSIKPKEPPKPPEFPGEEVKIKLYKGWNLISLPGKLVKFEKIDLTRKLIGFVYLKEEQKYVTLKEAEKSLGKEFREYLARNSFWIYSYQEVYLKVSIDRALSYSDIELKKGWNLVSITEDMLGGYLNDIKGDCGFEKLYLWNADVQAWQKINENYQFSDRLLNYGFLIKTKEDCRLGGSVVSLTPPQMPE